MPILSLTNDVKINRNNIEDWGSMTNLGTVTKPGEFCKKPFGWYKCELGTFTDGSASMPNNVGDFTVLNVGVNAGGYGCFLLFSPRFQKCFYYAQIWGGKVDYWTKIGE